MYTNLGLFHDLKNQQKMEQPRLRKFHCFALILEDVMGLIHCKYIIIKGVVSCYFNYLVDTNDADFVLLICSALPLGPN